MSQGSWQLPTGGSESATTFAGQGNTAFSAVSSQNSGATAPANGPSNAPVQFQKWLDTSNASFPVDRIFDGVNWNRKGTLDISNSIYCPQMGGGLSSIVSAATCDIGSKPGTLVTITGTTTITSFGTSAANGEEKRVYAGGQFTITNSANIICPGGQNIVTTTGDMFTAIYDGAGVWLIYGYVKAYGAAGIGKPVGELFWMYGTGVVPGAVRANGNTIGNTGSGASEFAGPAAINLFFKIWNESNAASDPEIVVSSGRGLTPLADWTALKTITTVDMRGRGPWGLDTMAAVAGAAGRVTNTTASPDGNTLGAVAGAQVVTLTLATMPAHSHTASSSSSSSSVSTDGGHTHSVPFQNTGNAGGSGATFGIGGASTSGVGFASISTSTSTSTSTTVNSNGSGGAHLNMQPSKGLTAYLAL